jgi:hypothetical protein
VTATAPEGPAQLVAALDPVAAMVAAATGYRDAPIALPDEQPLPGLRVRRRVAEPGLVVEVARWSGHQRQGVDRLEVARLPLDRAATPPRRRLHPAPGVVLEVRGDPDPTAVRPQVSTPDDGGAWTATIPRSGLAPEDLAALVAAARRARAVHLVGRFGEDPVAASALVLALAGAAIPSWTDDVDQPAFGLCAPELRAALAAAPASIAADDLELARAAALQRRVAWTEHDLTLRWELPGEDPAQEWLPRLLPPRHGRVGVLLATRRPALLPVALAMLADQRGVDVEVVVALHGVGSTRTAERALTEAGLDGTVLQVPAQVPFGAVLNAAAMRTDAPLLLKWDDDDLYGPEHVLDLVLAQRQTGAALVGKAPEFVYLQARDTTVWRTPGRAESDSLGLAGGTFLLPRAAFEEVGGYPPVGRAVDHHLKIRVRDGGGRVFRTHAFGFVLRRHAAGHTWDADDQRFLDQAVRTFAGLPSILELGPAAAYGDLAELRPDGAADPPPRRPSR